MPSFKKGLTVEQFQGNYLNTSFTVVRDFCMEKLFLRDFPYQIRKHSHLNRMCMLQLIHLIHWAL